MSQVITLDQLQQLNPAINDTVGALVVDAVNAWIENVTSRCWGEKKTTTERYDVSRAVWLRHMDIAGIESVKTGYPGDDLTEIDDSDYYCTVEGRLALKSWRAHYSVNDYLEVEYTYGTDEVPADLVLAGLGLANGYYEYVQTGSREVSRAQVGSYTLQFASGESSDGVGATVSRDTRVVKSYALRRV